MGPDQNQSEEPVDLDRARRIAWVARLVVYAVALVFLVPVLAGAEEGKHWLAPGFIAAGLLLSGAFAWPRVRAVLLALPRPGPLRVLDRLLGVGFASLVMLELSLMVLSHFSTSPVLQPPNNLSAERSVRTYRYKPHSIFLGHKLNAFGYNDTEFAKEKTADVARVIGLADSFGVGVVPYPHNYMTLLERPKKAGERGVEIYNFGVCAIGPRAYRWLYETEALAYQPDAVLVSIYVGNDLQDRIPPNRLAREGWYTYSTFTRLYRVIKELARQRREQARKAEEAKKEADNPGVQRPKKKPEEQQAIPYEDTGFNEEDYLVFERNRLLLCQRELRSHSRKRLQRQLDVITDFLESINLPVILAIIPDEIQVNTALRKKVLERFDLKEEEFDFDQPNRWVRELGEAIPHVAVVDLLEPLRKAELGGITYQPRNTHWNVRGNAVAVEAIRPVLDAVLPRRIKK